MVNVLSLPLSLLKLYMTSSASRTASAGVSATRAFPGERFTFFNAAIPDGKFMPGFEKIGRHAAAHGPETEIGDCLYHMSVPR
jgi:hypothetical protein